MKILILTEEQYPYVLGGGTSYLREFGKGLEHYKIDYEIIATRFYKAKNEIKSKKIKNLGVNLIKSDLFILRSIFKIYYYLAWYIAIFRYLIQNRRYKEFDIIHVHEIIFSGIISLILARVLGKRVVLTAHGKYVDGLKDRMHLPSFVMKLLYFIEKNIVSKMDLVFCISRDIRAYYSKYNKNCVFIGNFIDAAKFKKKRVNEIKTIGYIGRLSKEKNVDVIIKTAKFFPDKRFWIIGDGPERANLENLQRNLGLKNVEFLGRRSDIPQLHRKIDLVIYLWKNEPFGLSAIEAMASGIPVITADTNELHYFVGKAKAGITIPNDKISSEELKKAIGEISNKKILRQYSERAFKTAQEYGYKLKVKEYIDKYKEFL